MILVVGATGQLGTAVVRRLLTAGHAVRALVRPESRFVGDPKCERVTGDLRDPAALLEACDGVDAVIATATVVFPRGAYSFEHDEGTGYRNLIGACEDRGVGQIVFTSIARFPEPYASSVPTLRYKRRVEEMLAASPVPATILRAGPFMDDYFALMGSALPLADAEAHSLRRPFWLSRAYLSLTGGLVERRGVALALRPPHLRHDFVALDDVCGLAVRSIGHPAALDATLDVGGPESLCWSDVAALHAELRGRPVRTLAPLPAPVLRAASLALGPVSAAAANQLAILWALSSYEVRLDGRATAERLGVELTSARSFLRARLAAA